LISYHCSHNAATLTLLLSSLYTLTQALSLSLPLR